MTLRAGAAVNDTCYANHHPVSWKCANLCCRRCWCGRRHVTTTPCGAGMYKVAVGEKL